MEKQNTVVQERKEAGRSRWEKTVKFFRVLFKRKLVLVSTIGLIFNCDHGCVCSNSCSLRSK